MLFWSIHDCINLWWPAGITQSLASQNEVIRLLSCSAYLSIKLILLINVNMPKTIGFDDLNLKKSIYSSIIFHI